MQHASAGRLPWNTAVRGSARRLAKMPEDIHGNADLGLLTQSSELVCMAGLPRSYGTEVNKGCNLARFVRLRGGLS